MATLLRIMTLAALVLSMFGPAALQPGTPVVAAASAALDQKVPSPLVIAEPDVDPGPNVSPADEAYSAEEDALDLDGQPLRTSGSKPMATIAQGEAERPGARTPAAVASQDDAHAGLAPMGSAAPAVASPAALQSLARSGAPSPAGQESGPLPGLAVGEQPNIKPFAPPGWDYPIVPSSVPGTFVVNTLYGDHTTYIDFAVCNDGNATAGVFYVDFYIDGVYVERWDSGGSTLPGCDMDHGKGIADWTRTLPVGNHTLKLVTDATNVIAESDENDNTYEREFTWIEGGPPAPKPNLLPYKPGSWQYPIVPSSVLGTHSVNALLAGRTTYIDWAVGNNGAANAGTFSVDFYIDGEFAQRWSIYVWAGYYWEVNDWQRTLAAGEHTLKIVADATNVIDESNEDDNVYEQAFTWVNAPWINLKPYAPSGWTRSIVPASLAGTHSVDSLYGGRTTYIDWAITNAGPGATGAFSTTLLIDDNVVASWSTDSLGPNAFVEVEDWKRKLSTGNHRLQICADSTSVIAETDELDNCQVHSFSWIAAPAWPNLKPYKPAGWSAPLIAASEAGTYTPDAPYGGRITYIDWAVRNDGLATTAAFSTTLYVDDVPVKSWLSTGLPVGSSAFKSDWKLLNPLSSGDHVLKICTDAANVISELDESDNCYTRAFEWVEPPDWPNLKPSAPGGWSYSIVPSSVAGTHVVNALYAGRTTYVDWAETNDGLAASAAFSSTLFIDGVAKKTWSSTPGLPAGAETSNSDWKTKLTTGAHTLKICSDVTNVVVELDESDNCFQRAFNWVAPPALPNLRPFKPAGWSSPLVPSSVAGTHLLDTLFAGRTTYLDWAIRNDGLAATAAFSITLYVDDVPVKSWLRSAVAAGSYISFSDWRRSMTTGVHVLKLCADSANAITELDESDNCYTGPFEWIEPPAAP